MKTRESHPGAVVWMTGLPSAGKTTLAKALVEYLLAAGKAAYVLDGDALRAGLCADLSFSDQDRSENVRRIAAVAQLFASAGVIAVVAVIAPFASDRHKARLAAEERLFLEVFVDCPLAVCEARDGKGLYRKARDGLLKGLTGLDAPYERPAYPDVHVRSDEVDIPTAVAAIFQLL